MSGGQIMHAIKMPQAAKGMTDATIVRWLKNEGDAVQKGEPIADVEAEQGLVQIESPCGGILQRISTTVGKTVTVGEIIAEIAPTGETKPSTAVEAPKEAKTEPPKPGGSHGSVTPILMPQAGNTMEEGTIVKWLVAPGSTINKGDIIFEAETDKAVIEVEAVDAGRLARIVAGEGDTVPVKEPVAYLADNDADVDAYLAAQGGPRAEVTATVAPAAPEQAVALETTAAPAISREGRIKASPAARKMAKDRGVDLAAVGIGRGPGGRILSTDVLAAKPAVPAATRRAPEKGQVVRKPMSAMRKAIARNLLASKQTIPHFYIRMTCDAGPLMDFYQGEKAKYPCTINDVIAWACARLIQEFPAFRSRLDKDDVVEYPTANIGVAVGVEDGLVVPVLVGADRLSLKDLAAETKRIVQAARNGKVEGMGKGVFTITNLGMFGVEEFAAIINPPEAAILAVGAVREAVIVSGGAMRPGRVVTMTLSCDHRVVDGMQAAKFLARLKEILESPGQMLPGSFS